MNPELMKGLREGRTGLQGGMVVPCWVKPVLSPSSHRAKDLPTLKDTAETPEQTFLMILTILKLLMIGETGGQNLSCGVGVEAAGRGHRGALGISRARSGCHCAPNQLSCISFPERNSLCVCACWNLMGK